MKDLTGKTFGMITAVEEAPRRGKHRMWNCLCECGTKTVSYHTSLVSGATKSCGCVHTKHGMYGTSIYRAWTGMIYRCTNKRCPCYYNYGGRGITVCDRWRYSFKNFFEDMGEKPTPKHTIERINNEQGYNPENCTWATMKTQSNNRRTNKYITYKGKTMTIAEWSDLTGIMRVTISQRIRRGWSIEKTLKGGC